MSECIFCQIVAGKIPSAKVYESENVLAFLDIGPIGEGHTLIIPKAHHMLIYEVDDEVLSEMMVVSKRVAEAVHKVFGAQGFNLLQNNLAVAGQLIDHAHIHVIPRSEGDGFLTTWPAGAYGHGRMAEVQEKVADFLKG